MRQIERAYGFCGHFLLPFLPTVSNDALQYSVLLLFDNALWRSFIALSWS
jgi:hypothetical protein